MLFRINVTRREDQQTGEEARNCAEEQTCVEPVASRTECRRDTKASENCANRPHRMDNCAAGAANCGRIALADKEQCRGVRAIQEEQAEAVEPDHDVEVMRTIEHPRECEAAKHPSKRQSISPTDLVANEAMWTCVKTVVPSTPKT